MRKEKIVSFTGHRPKKLGGYNMKNPIMLKLKEALLLEIERLILEENAVKFISGGALGADQAAFWCVHILQRKYPYIKNFLAVPYKEQGKNWTPEQQYWHNKMKNKATYIYYVDELERYSRDKRTPVGKHSNYKLNIRNEFMVDKSHILVSIWGGDKKSGTWNCIRYALNKPHIEQIIQLDINNNFSKKMIRE